MDWRTLFTENWPYKAAALALAVFLWLNVSAEERQDLQVPTRLEVEVQVDEWVLVGGPEDVQTTFQGRRGDAFALGFSRSMPAIRAVVDSVTGPRMRLDLSPDMVDYDSDLNVRPIAVRPQRIEIFLERLASKRVAVAPDLQISAGANFSVVRPVMVRPESVTVSGATSEVETLTELRTERLTLDDLRTPVTRELRLRIPAGVNTVEVQPRSVLTTVEVDSLVERTVSRPLTLLGPAASAVVVDRDSITVSVRGPRRVVETFTPAQMVVYAEIEEVPDGEVSVPVSVELQGEVQLTASPDPPEVAVRPRGGAGGND